MSNLSRRGFLGAAGFGLAAAINPLRGMTLPSTLLNTSDRLITIFLRGAHDGVHTVSPVGDPTWVGAGGLRANFAPPTVPLSGTTFAALNQDFRVLTQNPASLPFLTGTPPDLAGHIAWIHQVGNPQGRRSHFTEQQIYETADVQPDTQLNSEGFVPRLRQRLQLSNPSLPRLFGASVSDDFQRMYRSTDPQGLMAHIDVDRLNGSASSPVAMRQRLALAQHLTQVQADPLAESVRLTSDFALSIATSLQMLNATPNPLRFPRDATEAAAVGLPPSAIGYRFMQDCELALEVATNAATACQVVGVEIGGWDTHGNQVQQRNVLDRWLAHALRSLYDLTLNLADKYTIVVMTEFGRTNGVNTAAGTDHGVGGLMMVLGERVNGGVYNCRPVGGPGPGVADWQPSLVGGQPNPLLVHDNAQNVATDFRTVFSEILRRRFLTTPSDLQAIVPNFTSVVAGPPSPLLELGCIN
jgi:uncharacterized protein (DUF1501 family)